MPRWRMAFEKGFTLSVRKRKRSLWASKKKQYSGKRNCWELHQLIKIQVSWSVSWSVFELIYRVLIGMFIGYQHTCTWPNWCELIGSSAHEYLMSFRSVFIELYKVLPSLNGKTSQKSTKTALAVCSILWSWRLAPKLLLYHPDTKYIRQQTGKRCNLGMFTRIIIIFSLISA